MTMTSSTISSQFLIDASTRGPSKIADTTGYDGHQVTSVAPGVLPGLEPATSKIAATNVMNSVALSSSLGNSNQSLTGPGLSQADSSAQCYSNAITNVPGFSKPASMSASTPKSSGSSTRGFGKSSSETTRTKAAETSGTVKPVFASASRKFFKSEKKLETTRVRTNCLIKIKQKSLKEKSTHCNQILLFNQISGTDSTSWIGPKRLVKMTCFCLRPSAKDQGITWVLLVLVHHLVHFLLKINLIEKKFWVSNRGPLARQLSYGNIETNGWKMIYLIISKTTPQTLDQYWSTLIFNGEGSSARWQYCSRIKI